MYISVWPTSKQSLSHRYLSHPHTLGLKCHPCPYSFVIEHVAESMNHATIWREHHYTNVVFPNWFYNPSTLMSSCFIKQIFKSYTVYLYYHYVSTCDFALLVQQGYDLWPMDKSPKPQSHRYSLHTHNYWFTVRISLPITEKFRIHQ